MQGIENILKPLMGMLEVVVPDAESENDASKFVENLIQKYIPEDLPKELIRKFIVDAVNKHPDEFDAKLRELYVLILQYFNRKPKSSAGL